MRPLTERRVARDREAGELDVSFDVVRRIEMAFNRSPKFLPGAFSESRIVAEGCKAVKSSWVYV